MEDSQGGRGRGGGAKQKGHVQHGAMLLEAQGDGALQPSLLTGEEPEKILIAVQEVAAAIGV